MRILVTGCNGYIGPVMTTILTQAGHEVRGVDTGYFAKSSSTDILHKDVRDLTVFDLAGFDAVAHLAALSNDPMGDLQPEWTHQINCEASLHLARIARDAGVSRFLFASSCSIYGASENEFATETSPVQPLSAYAISKVKTEEGLDKLANSAFSPVSLRNATAYGVSSQLRLDLVLNNLVAWAFTTGKVQIMSDGSPWRPIVHIEDIARAFAAVLDAPREAIHNQAFNVGATEENYQVRDLGEIVSKTVAGSMVSYAGKSSPDARNYRVNFSKIRQAMPEFRTEWTARRGAVELLAACRELNLREADLQNRRYIRLKQLRHLLDTGELDDTLRWRKAVAA
jgi:nucleoside-diphosphate-sugar epimerase